MIGEKWGDNKRPWTPLKKDAKDHGALTPDHVLGAFSVKFLDKDFVNSCYGSMHFTENYDELPVVVKLWLSTARFKQFVEMAKAFDPNMDYLLYSDFVEHDEDSMLALPLLATNGSVVVALAPRVISFDTFDVKKEVDVGWDDDV